MQRRCAVLQRDEGQKGPAQHLEHARQDPARARHEHCAPPAPAVGRGARRHEAQVVHLLADLQHERESHRGGSAEHQRLEVAAARGQAGQAGELHVEIGLGQREPCEGPQQQHHPQRLGPGLQTGDEGDAVQHHGDDDQRGQHVAPHQRPVQHQLQRQRHDGRLQGEEDEGEAGVDERGDGRAQVAKASAAREQIHVQPVTCRIDGDGQTREEGDQAHDQDGPERVGKAVVQRDGAADGLQRQKGHAAKGCVGHAQLAPFACTLGRVAQRVVLQRLVGYPGVVVAADAKDLLWCVVHACAFLVHALSIPVHTQEPYSAMRAARVRQLTYGPWRGLSLISRPW